MSELRWAVAGGVLVATLAAIIVVPVVTAEPVDRIAVRRLLRPADAPTAPAAPVAPPAAAPAAIAWDLPAGWSAAPAKPMRLAVFAVDLGGGISGECGIFVFPTGGDRLANVNRWRGQVGLEPLAEADLDRALTADACAFGPFAWLPVAGESKAFLAAIAATPQGQCFVKLEVPPDRLDAARDGFLAFCRSLRPGTAP
jgi:hypothetical protein